MGATLLLISWWTTRMAFFHTATSCRRSSGVKRSTSNSRWGWVFTRNPRWERWNVSSPSRKMASWEEASACRNAGRSGSSWSRRPLSPAPCASRVRAATFE